MAPSVAFRPLPIRNDIPYRFISSSTERGSVTGEIYSSENPKDPTVQLFTKEGCTLCDKVTEVLLSVRETHPHTLKAVDITDDDMGDWFSKYKYDIPVLHMNGVYWVKHQLLQADARQAFQSIEEGTFTSPAGEPDAGVMERRQRERSQ